MPSLPDEVELPEDDFDDAPLALPEDYSPEEHPNGLCSPEGPLRVPEGPPCDVFTTSPLGPGSCPVSLSLDLSSRDNQWVSKHTFSSIPSPQPSLSHPGHASSLPLPHTPLPSPSSPTKPCCSPLFSLPIYLYIPIILLLLIFFWHEFRFDLICLSYLSKVKKDTTGTLLKKTILFLLYNQKLPVTYLVINNIYMSW